MSYRFMRILVMFDLPVFTSEERKRYRSFRKFLILSGFLMLQESIYVKLVLNQTNADLLIQNIRRHKPEDGLVHVLTITEKQYSRMETLVGTVKSDVIDSTERLVIL